MKKARIMGMVLTASLAVVPVAHAFNKETCESLANIAYISANARDHGEDESAMISGVRALSGIRDDQKRATISVILAVYARPEIGPEEARSNFRVNCYIKAQ